MKRLSIIVPMFNVELYVERCLRSLEDQDIPRGDYEIICINDGSPDDSRGVVIRLQKEFENIRLIDQENQGVSCARNNGIDIACGRYILFIDPDDYIDSNSLNHVLHTSDKLGVQVCFLGYTVLNEDGKIHKKVYYEDNLSDIYSGTKTYFLGRRQSTPDPDRMWAVLLEKKFLDINKLRFLPYVPYLEDGEFIARILCLAERCSFLEHSFYQRTTRTGSATNSNLFYSKRATDGFLRAAINLKNFQKSDMLNRDQRIFLNQPICKFVFLAIGGVLQKPYFRYYNIIKNTLLTNDLRRLELAGVARPYSNYVSVYNFSIAIFILSTRTRFFRVIIKILFGKSMMI